MVSPGRKALPAGAVVCGTFGKRTCKPNSVVCGHSSRRRVAADAHQRPTRRFRRPADGSPLQGAISVDLSEQPCGAGPAPGAHPAPAARLPPYLVLLRVGFTLPRPLQDGRCALAAPFHPYPGAGVVATANRPGKPGQLGYCVSRVALQLGSKGDRPRGSRGGIFSVALAVHEPLRSRPGRYPAHCPAEFGLSSPGGAGLPAHRQRPPGPPASPQSIALPDLPNE